MSPNAPPLDIWPPRTKKLSRKPIKILRRCFQKFLTSPMRRSGRRCRSPIIRRRRRPIPRISTTNDFYRSWKVAGSSKNSTSLSKRDILRELLLAQSRQCRLDTRPHAFECARELSKLCLVGSSEGRRIEIAVAYFLRRPHQPYNGPVNLPRQINCH